MPRVRLQDIADALSIHKSTVSLALRNDRRIPEKTRKRVLRMAETLGYRRNASLEMLANYRWPDKKRKSVASIAIIHPSSRDILPNKLRELETSAADRASELGFSSETFFLSDYKSPASLGRMLLSRGISGLLIFGGNQDQHWQGFPFDKFCCVGCQGGFGLPDIHLVRENHFSDFVNVYQNLSRLGYQRIGLMPQFNEWSITDERRLAAAYFLNHHIIPRDERMPVLPIKYGESEPIIPWIRAHRPQAVITCTPGVYYFLEENNIAIPDDLALAFLEVEDENRGKMAGIGMSYSVVGRRAVDFVLDMLRRNDFGVPESQEILSVRAEYYPGETAPARH